MRDENMLFNTVTAVEYEAAEADKARALGLHDSEVVNQDFHRFCLDTENDLTLLSAILRLYVISIMMLHSKSLQTKSSRMQNSNVRNSQMRG